MSARRPESAGATWDRIWSRQRYAGARDRATRAAVKAEALLATGLRPAPGGHLLDLGCGSGDVSDALAARGFGEVRFVGCDHSLVAARRSHAKLPGGSLSATQIQADATCLPFASGCFDAVFSCMLLQHLGEAETAAMLGEVKRVLRNGGELIVVVPSRRSIVALTNIARRAVRRPTYDRRGFSAREIDQLLSGHFRLETSAVQQIPFDRPLAALADRALGALLPRWGRYLAVRCTKVAS